MGVKAAIDRLDSWVVTGVTNLGYQEGAVSGPFPALISRMGGTGGETLRPLGITADQGKVVVHVEHVLLICGIGLGLADRSYGALTHIDNYLAAVVDDLDLGGNLLEPLAIADTSLGPELIGNVLYYAILFRHRWVLKVT